MTIDYVGIQYTCKSSKTKSYSENFAKATRNGQVPDDWCTTVSAHEQQRKMQFVHDYEFRAIRFWAQVYKNERT